jgi:ectoine hydroxylase-related dioxygenase (phytanoyl-CoA dioxygenase family)
MAERPMTVELSAESHAAAMRDYMREGEARALTLGNRGPLRFESDGAVHRDILEAYWRCGFYVLEDVIGEEELAELRADVERVVAGAPIEPGASVDARGRPAIGVGLARPSFSFARPLSDPLGGTGRYQGRHPVKMQEPTPAAGAPERTVELLLAHLQIMDSCLRLYGHSGLLAVAEAVNGPDFVPFNEVVFMKEAGLGVSVAWHRDGTTHWSSPTFHPGSHGFNFMAQLYGSTPGNGVWALPGTHVHRAVDVRALVEASGSERIRDAVPMISGPGDVIISNRQLVHGSFANTSPDRRVTVNFGFLPRASVLSVTATQLDGRVETYDAARVHQRSRMIAVAIDARHRRFPRERRYVYQPLRGEEDANRWTEAVRESVVKNYNLLDVHI